MRTKRRNGGVGLFLCLVCVLPALSVRVSAQVDANGAGEKAYVNPGNMFPKVEDLVGVKLEEEMRRYLAERGWKPDSSAANPGNAWIGWGSAEIKLEPDDVRYGEARIAAFHRAFADAKGKFVVWRMIGVSIEETGEFKMDRYPEDIPDADRLTYIRERLNVAAEKGMDLGEAHLDKLLREVGIDPADYHKVGREKRKQVFHDAIARTVTIRAISSLTGLRIVTTFEDLRSVGVLVMHSEGSERIARQVDRGEAVSRRPADVVGSSIQDQLAKALPSDVGYIGVHGVRIMQDDAGENVLVAFGQSAPSITKTTSQRLLQGEMRAAREMARLDALAALTEFVNSTLRLDLSGGKKDVEDISLIILGSSRTEERETYEIGKRIGIITDQSGSAKWEGVTTIKTWTANSPRTGHVLVGHVLMWSPATRDAARGKFLKEEKGKPAEKVKYDNTVIEAPALDHLDPTLRKE